jgi:hypothetical protein
MLVKFDAELQYDTKGAIRFGEILPNGKVAAAPKDPGANVGTLYVRKTSLVDGEAIPKKVRVTIESIA